MGPYLGSKIDKATVTEAKINYTGSITIDKELIEKQALRKDEKPMFLF